LFLSTRIGNGDLPVGSFRRGLIQIVFGCYLFIVGSRFVVSLLNGQ
jgi:hypothetical protein